MGVPAPWYPEAKRIPLDFVTTPDKTLGELPKLDARVVIEHTNGGKRQPDTPRVAISLAGWFNGRYKKTGERLASHLQFMRNGKIEQYVPFDRQAFAQWGANPYAISCEFEDDGDPNRPLTDEQIESFIAFMVWTGLPPRLVKDTDDSGIGYHQQFREWNRGGHNCPGPVRVTQLIEDVIPALQRRKEPSRHPSTAPHKGATVSLELPVLDEHDRREGPYTFSAVVLTAQTLVNAGLRRFGVTSDMGEDGKFGPNTTSAVKEFQEHANLKKDGVIGSKTWRKLLGLS